MDFNKALMVGAGSLLVGLILGYSMGGSGNDEIDAQLAKADELSARVESMSQDMAGMGERLGGIEGVVTAMRAAQTEGMQGLGARVDGMGQQLSSSVERLGSGMSDAMKAQVEALRGQIDGLRGSAAEESEQGEEGEQAQAEAPAAPQAAASGIAVTPGGTAILVPGRLHVFLSAADAEGGRARVAVNGQMLVPLEVGKAVEVDGCAVELTGFDIRGAAMIDGGC